LVKVKTVTWAGFGAPAVASFVFAVGVIPSYIETHCGNLRVRG
jgi:hypothetical protein